MTVTVRYFAAAAQAAGIAEESHEVGSLGELLDTLHRIHGAELTRVLGASSFLVDGISTRDPAIDLAAAHTVDILPPFAGG